MIAWCHVVMLLASVFFVVAMDTGSSSSASFSVMQAPGERYYLLTPAPLKPERVWGLHNVPTQALAPIRVPPRYQEINRFDYTLPGSYRRMSGLVTLSRLDIRFGQSYIAWVEQQVHKQYTKRFGEQIQVVLGSAGQQYMFDAKQALMLHVVQSGLRKVTTTMTLDQQPFRDPVESVRLRAFLESSFDNIRLSAFHPDVTYPHVLRLALLRIQEQQKSEPTYQAYSQIFDDNWNIVFPFLQDRQINMVEYLLRPS